MFKVKVSAVIVIGGTRLAGEGVRVANAVVMRLLIPPWKTMYHLDTSPDPTREESYNQCMSSPDSKPPNRAYTSEPVVKRDPERALDIEGKVIADEWSADAVK